MIIIKNKKHFLHNPKIEFDLQNLISYFESADRIFEIEKALNELPNLRYEEPQEYHENILQTVHSKKYIDYIKEVSDCSIDDEDYRTPFVIPLAKPHSKNSTKRIDQVAFFAMDTTTPIGKYTFSGALHSACVALTGAEKILQGEKLVYSLCRPPGHHAEKTRYGGYCFFNNAAIAAEHLIKNGKVAILDIDYHHGNGTQEIFYNRNDVLYVSLHADPSFDFPYYSGFADETGSKEGLGYNINFPLPKDTTNEQYLTVLEKALEKINAFNCEFLIVSLGVDTFEDDPVGGFKLTKDVYSKISKTINQIQKPILIVQEGGYLIKEIGNLVVNFLKGF